MSAAAACSWSESSCRRSTAAGRELVDGGARTVSPATSGCRRADRRLRSALVAAQGRGGGAAIRLGGPRRSASRAVQVVTQEARKAAGQATLAPEQALFRGWLAQTPPGNGPIRRISMPSARLSGAQERPQAPKADQKHARKRLRPALRSWRSLGRQRDGPTRAALTPPAERAGSVGGGGVAWRRCGDRPGERD